MIDYPKYKKVLFCTDFSKNCELVFDYAFGIAKRDEAMLYILHVIPTIPDQYHSEIHSFFQKDNIYEINKSLETSCIEKYENEYLRNIKDKEKVKFIIRHGREEDEILKFAEEEGVDIIVIGIHGETGVRHAILGSVAERIIRQSSVPVFIISSKTLQKLNLT